MTIWGLIGRPGQGKTYDLTRRVLEAADRDRLVFTNYAVKHPNVYLFGADDLLNLPPGLLALDEAHLWFPARGAMRLPMSWLQEMSQTRKNGWDLIWSTQNEKRVDSVIKDVTDWMYLVKAHGRGGNPPHPRWFTSTAYEPENFRKKGEVAFRTIHRFDKRVAAAYSTHERLSAARHTIQKNDAYASAEGGV